MTVELVEFKGTVTRTCPARKRTVWASDGAANRKAPSKTSP